MRIASEDGVPNLKRSSSLNMTPKPLILLSLLKRRTLSAKVLDPYAYEKQVPPEGPVLGSLMMVLLGVPVSAFVDASI